MNQKPTPEQAERLREAVAEASRSGKSQDRLAKAAGYAGQSALGMALSRGSRPKRLPELLAELGVRMEWYKTGALPKFADAQAHAVSQDSVTSHLQRDPELVKWGDLGMRELPDEFTVESPDDAMAPEIRRGRKCEFAKYREGMPLTDEDIVLIQDASEDWYIRYYVPLTRKRWQGAAGVASRIIPMDSREHDLKIIAVLTKVVRRTA